MKFVPRWPLWVRFRETDNPGVGGIKATVTTSPALRPVTGPFELLMLSALPCGCVAADYRAPSLAVDLIALEAKGPHCTIADHRAGHVLELGESLDVVDLPPDPLRVSLGH